jgi:hypothetical protein
MLGGRAFLAIQGDFAVILVQLALVIADVAGVFQEVLAYRPTGL